MGGLDRHAIVDSKRSSTSWTIDYGTWPNQKRAYFTQASARHRIDDIYKTFPTHEIRIMAAMADLFRMLFDRQFQREDGSILRLNIAGIDANDETEAIKEGIRKAGLTGRLWPMHSRSFRAKTPLNEMAKKEGDVIGENWRRRKPTVGSMRYITYDTDAWKTHHRDRLIMPSQVPGSLTWFAGRDHKLLADHHCAEVSEMVSYEKTGSTVEQWTCKPGEDNHLWDVGVGNDVLGSVLGLKLPTGTILRADTKPKKRRKRIRVTM